MPVTAKLSRKLYETFGDEDTNELVDLLNSVHTYRGELRELNESNFQRFNSRLAELNATWEGRFTAFDAKLEQRLAELRRDLSLEITQGQQATLKWMFTFWAPTALGIGGTAIAVVALLLRR